MRSVLLLDGCPLTRECLSLLLREEGYKVLAAGTGAQAKELIAKRPPDLMVCELVVPDGSTLGVLRWIREQPSASSIRVCVLTNVAAKKPLTQAVEAGVNAVMLKARFTFRGLVKQLEDLSKAHGEAPSEQAGEKESKRYPLPIPAPDQTLELRQHKPIISRPDLEQRLGDHPLPPFSETVVAHVRAILDSDTCEMETLANAIAGDPGLYARVFQAAAGTDEDGTECEEPAPSIFEAVLRIGLDTLREILDEASYAEHERVSHQSGFSMSMDQQRVHGIAVSVIAGRIASLCDGIDEKEAMTAGLLHDCGRLRMLGAIGDRVVETATICHELGVSLDAGEKRMLLSEHEKLGLSMTSDWNLTKDVVQAIGYHHEDAARISSVCSNASRLVGAVSIADKLAHAMGYGHTGSTVIEPTEALFELLESEEISLGAVVEGLREDVDSAIKRTGLDPALLTDGVMHAMPDLPTHPVFVSADPETDAIGLWLGEEFGAGDGETLPNMIVVHGRHAKDRNELSDKINALHQQLIERGVSEALPMLILSPSGRYNLSEDVMTRHLCMNLRTPFGVSLFERSCTALLSGKQELAGAEPMKAAA
ncbi:MAG: HDOD domain-containing protein [Phycisphaerales bacterium]